LRRTVAGTGRDKPRIIRLSGVSARHAPAKLKESTERLPSLRLRPPSRRAIAVERAHSWPSACRPTTSALSMPYQRISERWLAQIGTPVKACSFARRDRYREVDQQLRRGPSGSGHPAEANQKICRLTGRRWASNLRCARLLSSNQAPGLENPSSLPRAMRIFKAARANVQRFESWARVSRSSAHPRVSGQTSRNIPTSAVLIAAGEYLPRSFSVSPTCTRLALVL